jgi:BirA family biotin operon repressor/biotin-[acetyl-CoA-carboxylase] ligase
MSRFHPRLPRGYRLLSYDSIGSTNEEAIRLARDGAAEETFVWALKQTAGRGRRGRTWISPPGNFYASLILRPNCPPGRAAQLGFVAALAIGEAVRAILPRVGRLAYKWPNDVLLDGRKVAGVLLESEMMVPDRLNFVVLGTGVNLVASPQDTEFPATSITEAGLGRVAPEVMLEEFARHFQLWDCRWRANGFSTVRTAWLADAAIARGEPIRVRLETTTLHGQLLDVDEDGTLLLDIAGECRRIAAGEVFPANC